MGYQGQRWSLESERRLDLSMLDRELERVLLDTYQEKLFLLLVELSGVFLFSLGWSPLVCLLSMQLCTSFSICSLSLDILSLYSLSNFSLIILNSSLCQFLNSSTTLLFLYSLILICSSQNSLSSPRVSGEEGLAASTDNYLSFPINSGSILEVLEMLMSACVRVRLSILHTSHLLLKSAFYASRIQIFSVRSEMELVLQADISVIRVSALRFIINRL